MGLLKLSVLAMAVSAAGFGCSADSDVARYVDGMLIDYTAFDGCGWVIDSDRQLFEPININDTNIVKFNLTDSLTVRFAYVEDDNQRSECRVGTVVRLLDIYEK